MAKQAKSAEHRWRISLIRGTPAQFLGHVSAPTQKRAVEIAAEQFNIADVLRNRIVARRDD